MVTCKLNAEAVRDFFGSCYTEVANDTSYSLSPIRRKNLMILGLFSESLNTITTDNKEKDRILEDSISYGLVRNTIFVWANGTKISEIDDETIDAIVDIMFIHTAMTTIKIEALRNVN